MKKYISANEIFITYEQRSAIHFHRLLTAHIIGKFGRGAIGDRSMLKPVLQECYDWCADSFANIILPIDDKLFVLNLFAYHESSVKLWQRVLAGEDIYSTIEVNEDDLAMNRRIFKLALEQTCDVTYTHNSAITQALIQRYDEIIEDLLFLGSELYGFAQQLAEMRMIQDTFQLSFNSDDLLVITRPKQIESVFSKLISMMQEDFSKGIFDEKAIDDMKMALQNCMHINYDFAGHQIVVIKKHHSPQGWEFQTIEPRILIQNQVAQGASLKEAIDFYDGLTFSKRNKLPIKESVYKVNAMERFIFRPILIINENGNERQLIGVNKWAESITVLATNGFQWNKAANEWKNNACFAQFLSAKGEAHDSLLEDKVVEVLTTLTMPFDRNVVTVSGDGKAFVRVDVLGIGEMDFIWADQQRNTIVVADCKYSRARYDMLSFTADYSNFKQSYEQQLANKVNWVEQNKELVCEHLARKFPGLSITANSCRVEGVFIINTPTFYMFHGSYKAVCFFRLEEFIRNNYNPPAIVVEEKTRRGVSMSMKKYPYFT